MDQFIGIGIFLVLLLVGLVGGKTAERRHFASLARREAGYDSILVTSLKRMPPGISSSSAELVSGAVVIGSDYLKTFLAQLRKFIGGEVKSFDRMMERGRREAICRMLAEAEYLGAHAVINVRVVTSFLHGPGAANKSPMPMVEILAYGTALQSDQPGPA